jgi:hypothetical protein
MLAAIAVDARRFLHAVKTIDVFSIRQTLSSQEIRPSCASPLGGDSGRRVVMGEFVSGAVHLMEGTVLRYILRR